jgi:hypothetical protein
VQKKLEDFCMKKSLQPLLAIAFVFSCAMMASAFPVYDPFNYTPGQTLWGQTDANGDYWWEIDSGGTAPNAIDVVSFSGLTYPGLPASAGNAILLTNVSGPGGRMFVSTNGTTYFFGDLGGLYPGPISVFYSMLIDVTNMTSLSTTGDYCFGFNDIGSTGSQGNNPGTMADRIYFMKGNGTDFPATNYEIGISKTVGGAAAGATVYYATNLFTTNQVVFIVVDIEIQGPEITPPQQNDICRLWINPASSTFGAATQPAATVVDPGGGNENNMTPYTSTFIFENRATDTPNDLLIGQFRMGTNWSWMTGGPAIINPEPASTNVYSTTFTLNITAPNNGSSNSYQWLFNGANLTNGLSVSGSGATVSGATTNTLTVTNAGSKDNGSYSVVVTNSIGTVSSFVSAVTVFGTPTPPTIQTQPSPASVPLYPGGSAAFSFTAFGTVPIVYYWHSNSAVVAVTTNNPALIFSNVQASATCYCMASNSFGTSNTVPFYISVLPLPSAPYPAAVIHDLPVDFFPLNEHPDNTTGDNGVTAFDYMDGNDGSYTNAIIAQPGYGPGLAAEYSYGTPTDTNTSAEFGFYPSYPATSSFVNQIQNVSFAANSFGPSFSIEAWAQGSTSGELSGATIVSKGWGTSGNGYGDQFTLDYASGWQFYVRNASGNTTTALSTDQSGTDGNWHHLVGVLNVTNDTVLLYVDGMLQASNNTYAPTIGIFATTNPVTIGCRMSTLTSGFNYNWEGNIQDVAIYNYALTAAQVQTHYLAAGIPPQFSQQPPNSTNLSYGDTLTLAAAAIGSSPLSYEWIDGSTGQPVPGATNTTLVISNDLASDSYYMVATSPYGTADSSSSSITVYRSPGVVLDISPLNTSAVAGSSVSFSVGVDGATPISYWWQFNNNPLTNGGRISGANTNVLTISGVQLADAGSYQLFASNTYGGPVSSSAAVLAVTPTLNFNDGGSGWFSQSPSGSIGWEGNNLLQLTGGSGNEDSAVFYSYPVYIGGFNAAFTYQVPTGSNASANGATFCIQNDQRGVAAIGGDGGQLGVGAATSFPTSSSPITPSVELELNIYSGNGVGGVGISFNTNGAIGPTIPTSTLVINSGDNINVAATYLNKVLSVNLTDATAGTQFSASANLNIPALVGGNTAYVGFTAADSAQASQQQISNFTFWSLPGLTIQATNNQAVISWPVAVGAYVLQRNSSLLSTNWVNVTNAAVTINGQSQVTVSPASAAQFYRLFLQ